MQHDRLFVLSAIAMSIALACDAEPASDDPGDLDDVELQAGPPPGKADNAGIAGLPVNGNYAATEAWRVRNQWEDTTTTNARAAGIAWPADSGLTWDQKYARWVESLGVTQGESGTTIAITNPWGKTIQAAKLDCADVALTLRASFAAWYELPFYVVSFDGNTPVYFGHFGIRTASGKWSGMPSFATQYADHSALGEDALDDWPQDAGLRTLGVQTGDEQPFLGAGARTGAWLDEIHLNKRAARFIRLMLIYNGSANLADTRNTYNLRPEAIREGDVNLHRWQRNGIGHTMLAVEVDDLGAGKIDVRIAEGSLPPIQPQVLDGTGSGLRLTSAYAGGADESEDYASLGGGLKRFRVAKNVGGRWTNTWMAADEASWIDSSDLDAIRERPVTFTGLLGEVDPEQRIAALLSIVASKREHLQDFPASCSARTAREQAFDHIYATATEELGMTKAEVDAMWRVEDDYIFAELDYAKSKTCCWNSTNNAMYQTIVDFNAKRQADAAACLPPVVFKATGGGYETFRAHDPVGWIAWSADETCPQRNVLDDTEAEHAATPYCDWKDAPTGAGGSCAGHCGGQGSDGTCWCDAACADYGDCCADHAGSCR